MAITTHCAYLHHTLVYLKRYFSASLVTPLANSEQINHNFSNHTYTKSTPNYLHHHYFPVVTQHTIISSTSPIFVVDGELYKCINIHCFINIYRYMQGRKPTLFQGWVGKWILYTILTISKPMVSYGMV